ncbi:MAG TPA: Bcr/CflA family efflux MFS transporter [Gammaproteobacteria bacterium]|nr:Bcr/CflA family efflux MFS transporter [Gammaproteobacteria bacterium]
MNKLKKLLFPYLLIVYEVVLYLSNDMYLPSMPTIADDLVLSEHEIQSTLTFWFLGASSLQFLLGPLSDRYGRRIVILSGALFFILSSAVCAIATSLGTLLIARLVQGTAVCTLVAGYAAVNESFNTKQAISLFAIIGAITILAPALGPLFGSIVLQFASWRHIFWCLAILNSLTLIALYFYLPETNLKRRKFNFKTIRSHYAQILSNRDFLIPCASYFLIVAIEFLWAFESPFLMMEVYHTSIMFYGVAQSVIFGCFLLGAAATKWLLDHYSVKALIVYGMSIIIVGTIAFWLCSIFHPTLTLGIAFMMVIALGSSMLIAPFTRIALQSCQQPTGTVTAVFTTATNLAGVAIGLILSMINSTNLFVVATIALICVALTLVLVMYLRMPSADKKTFKSLF